MNETLLTVWHFATIMLMALAMTAAVAHVMELPPKMKFEPRLYVMLHRTLFPNFGRVAGTAEFLALVAVIGLAWRMHGEGSTFALTLVSTILMVAAHGVFWVLVQPANTTMAGWSLDAIPADWTRWRNRWEYSHAIRAVLQIGALGALVLSVL